MIETILPPHDLEAEEAVIGSLLLDPDAMEKITFLSKGDFFDEAVGLIYEACQFLFERSIHINQISIAHEMNRRGILEGVGGCSYLSHLIAITPTHMYVKHYAELVFNTSVMRQLISAAGKIASVAYENDPDVKSSLKRIEDIISAVKKRVE